MTIPGGQVESFATFNTGLKSGVFPWSSLYMMDTRFRSSTSIQLHLELRGVVFEVAHGERDGIAGDSCPGEGSGNHCSTVLHNQGNVSGRACDCGSAAGAKDVVHSVCGLYVFSAWSRVDSFVRTS